MKRKLPFHQQTEWILDSLHEGICLLDVEGILVFENAAATAMFGRSGRMAGDRAHDCVHHRRSDGSVYPVDRCPIQATLRDGKPRLSDDEVFWRDDGTSFPVEYSCAPLRDEAGVVIGAVVSFRDAAESRRAEAALYELTRQLEGERARLVAAQSVAKIGSWETDLANLAVVWSEETHRIFETGPGSFRPTHEGFLQKVHPEDREKVNAAFAASLNDCDPHWVEHRVVLSGGRTKVVEERWRCFADEAGKIVKAIGTCQDVTERRRTERLLRESEEKFSTLFQSSPAKIAIGAMDGKLLDVNRAYAEFLGYSREEMIGRSLAELGVIGEGELRRLLALGAVPGAAMRDVELTVRARGGAAFQVLMSADVLALGGELRRVATLVDITERKQEEEERRKLQAQSLRAQRMESIGTLAGGMAHDLNNMLSPVMMALQILQTKSADAETDEVLRELHGCMRRAADMVKQVLSFARGVEGRRMPVDIDRIAGEVRRIARDTFPKSIEFHLNAAENLWPVIGDPTQLQQVLLNLCVNARDAMPGGGRITVSLDNEVLDSAGAAGMPDARPGAFVRVVMADTGPGVPADIREKIFEPFFTTKAIGQGTGLGLSTSLAIVKSHGGFLALDGSSGAGARFVIYLPASAATPAPGRDERRDLPAGRGELLLIVDDEEAIRGIARRTLEHFGYRVLLAAGGREALAIYRERGPEIAAVLTDMSMPDMDGPALVSALREINPGVVVIGSSGLTSGAEAARSLGNVRGFLAKPYTGDALLQTLRRSLDESEPRA